MNFENIAEWSVEQLRYAMSMCLRELVKRDGEEEYALHMSRAHGEFVKAEELRERFRVIRTSQQEQAERFRQQATDRVLLMRQRRDR